MRDLRQPLFTPPVAALTAAIAVVVVLAVTAVVETAVWSSRRVADCERECEDKVEAVRQAERRVARQNLNREVARMQQAVDDLERRLRPPVARISPALQQRKWPAGAAIWTSPYSENDPRYYQQQPDRKPE